MSHDGNRRDFLYVATAATGGVLAVSAGWTMVDQMNPSKDVLALGTIEVDVSEVEPGTEIKVFWRGKPVFIRRRTQDEIADARGVTLGDLKDLGSENDNKPGTDAEDKNRTLDDAGEWLVMVGVCTHLGCIPLGATDGARGEFGGWFCPCHGSHYDTSGRIRKGPAPKNLLVPTASFADEDNTIIKLG
ncbi:MAG: ubiquinol-cytochrome c reductase iron-sulfur subunit [Pseudomonadota bacterium]